MATAGVPIDNPVTGERIVFRKTLKDTNGGLVEFDQYLQPGGGASAEHVHLTQDERYTIVSGVASYTLNSQPKTAQAGEIVVIPHGTIHTNPWNPPDGKGELHLIRVVDPGTGVETFYETLYGLARDGKTDKYGNPNVLQMIVIGAGIGTTTYFMPKQIPVFLQRIMIPVIGAFGRLLGYRASYPKYSGAAQ